MRTHAKGSSKSRGLFGLACLCVLGLAAFLGSGAPSVGAAESFPGQGFLPDDRAWELVTPTDKKGGALSLHSQRTRMAADGSAASFISSRGFADVQGVLTESEYLARRTAEPGSSGWSTHAISPPQEPLTIEAILASFGARYDLMTPDLSAGVFLAWSPASDADPNVENVTNLYARHDLLTAGAGTYDLLTECPACASPLSWQTSVLKKVEKPWTAGASADLGTVAFESKFDLTGVGGKSTKAYAADENGIRLIGLVPSGSESSCGGAGPACVLPTGEEGGSIFGLGATGTKMTPGVVSSDGARLNFTAPVSGVGVITTGSGAKQSKLYQRNSQGTASTVDDTTVRLNVSEREVPESPRAAYYQTASADGQRVFFISEEPLTDEAPEELSAHIYLWHDDYLNDEQQLTVNATAGQFKLVFDGEPTADLPFDATPAQVEAALEALPAISVPGGQVTVSGGPGDEGGTTPYSIAFTGDLAGEDQPTMTTAAGTAPLSGGAASATVAPRVKGGGHLTLIDRDEEPADAPGKALGVIGASEDGSRVYFLANSQLVAGEEPLPAPIESFQPHGIFLWEEGEVSYVGSLVAERSVETNVPGGLPFGETWEFEALPSRVSPDGRTLLFRSQDPIGPTGYDQGDTCDVQGITPCAEFHVYDAEADTLACASCNHGASEATADAAIFTRLEHGGASGSIYLNHALSDDGRFVFFSTREALAPEDVNGKIDAYRYDVQSDTQRLISSGKSSGDSFFMDASANGVDVLFATKERLSEWDGDSTYDYYDARIGGGLPEPAIEQVAPCAGDSCQGSLGASPAAPPAASAQVKGAGNRKPTRGPSRCRRAAAKGKRGSASAKKQGKKRAKGCRGGNRRAGR